MAFILARAVIYSRMILPTITYNFHIHFLEYDNRTVEIVFLITNFVTDKQHLLLQFLRFCKCIVLRVHHTNFCVIFYIYVMIGRIHF